MTGPTGEIAPLFSAGSLSRGWFGWRWTAYTCTADGTVVDQGKGRAGTSLWAQVYRNRWLIDHGAVPLTIVEHIGRTEDRP